MVVLSTFFAVLFGLPLGMILSTTKKDSINPMPRLNAVLSALANVFRSFPFIILIIVVWPLSRLLVGSSIGPNAAIVSLSIAAIPFVARLFEGTLDEVNKGLIEATLSMGASKLAVMRMMLMESMPALVNTITILVISVIGYSAMAGAVGGGGLGTLALNEGFNNGNLSVLYSCVIVLMIIVQVAQSIGDYLSNMLRSRNYGIFRVFFK
ncbi:methionine ABC transporter permease [Helicobacter saguini]|nr:methionine ABC transporter permease [Helicobacter saguini]